MANDDGLMNLMKQAGFDMVFIGIETPDVEVLKSMNKIQNTKNDLISDIKKIQKAGFEFTAGFIIGNDREKLLQSGWDYISANLLSKHMAAKFGPRVKKGKEARSISQSLIFYREKRMNPERWLSNFIALQGLNLARIKEKVFLSNYYVLRITYYVLRITYYVIFFDRCLRNQEIFSLKKLMNVTGGFPKPGR